MGFYGNITNTARTQFQFDKVYSSRYEMDNNKGVDGIYAGRYVLIEYDKSANLDNFQRVELYTTYTINGIKYYVFNYNPSINNVLQNSTNLTKEVANASNFQIVYTATIETTPSDNGPYVKNPQFYIYRPDISPSSSFAYYERINDIVSNEVPTYTVNYNIDVKAYGAGRAYDSTVWQKVYTEGIEKYVMIAELNTVVPTFDITADAPTQLPLIPHFDPNSTDVYYKLHWQPSWGMRVKSAENQIGPEFNEDGTELEGTSVNYSTNLMQPIMSDETTIWKRNDYDTRKGVAYSKYWNPNTSSWEDSPSDINAAIYYNKDGFSSEIITIEENTTDKINVEPTGKSGYKYNSHSGIAGDYSVQEDIQELTILLPSIGNSIAKMWNIVYGNYEQNGNSNIRNQDIAWDSYNGLRMVKEDKNGNGFTFEPDQVNTLAGVINSVHDLMGMIIENPDINLTDQYASNADENKIYYYNGKYYRKAVGYNYTPYEGIITDDSELYVVSDVNNLFDIGCKWNSKVKDVPNSVILATREAYYTFVELKGFARELNTIHGLILKTNYLLLSGDVYTRDRNTVQGCINVLNDIINKFEIITPGDIMTVDSYGRVHSTPYTTTQPYTTYNYGKVKNNGNQKTLATAEDRWIRLDIDSTATNPLITIKHEFTSQPNTTTSADKNNTDGNGNNANDKDSIDLYTPIVDSTGHIVGHNIETVTLPYSYKFFNTTGHSTNNTTDLDTKQDSVSADGSTVTAGTAITSTNMQADNTKDTMSINPYNKWIQTKFSNDKLEIAHEVHGVQTNVLATNLNKDNVTSSSTNDKITIQDIAFDAAGHVTKNQAHTYTLPYGFKTVTPATQSTAVTNPTVNTTSIVAENTQDTLTLASSNKWIRMSADANNDTLSIGHEVHNFEAGTHSTKYGLTSDKDIVTLDVNNTFEVPVFKFDEAGHITFAETHTINLPENFTNIQVLNTNASSVAVNGASSTGTIAADTLTDTFTMDIGNRWIQINTDATNDKITFYHAAPGNQTNTSLTGNETPNFGTTFKIPEIKYDEAGHISGVSSHTVQLPLPSLNDLTATTASVLTGISMNGATGAITQTNADVGTLTLNGYVLNTEDNSILLATDTINTAFSKLQQQLIDLTTELNTLKEKVSIAHPEDESGDTPTTDPTNPENSTI